MVDGAIIKLRRTGLKLTMAEAAQRAGFKQRQDWNKLESGRIANPTVATLYAVAQVLSCSMEDLIDKAAAKARRKK